MNNSKEDYSGSIHIIRGVKSKKGVSPVIGVVLMVAITVALVSLVTVVVFNIQPADTDNPSSSTIQVSDGQSVTLVQQGDRTEAGSQFEVTTDGATVGVLEDM